jgi:hypothetical protein
MIEKILGKNWFHKILGSRPRPSTDVAGLIVSPERLAALRPDDQFLVSYPRSGNTWVRHLLREVIIRGRPDLPPPEKLWMLIPDLHVHPMEHPARGIFGMPTRIFKSHNLRDLRGRRIVYIFREPADTLISYFHFHVRGKIEPALVAQGPDAFCQAMLPRWCEHVNMALDEIAVAPSRMLLVSYEMLTQDGARALGAITRFLGLKADEAVLTAAIEQSKFENLQAKEAQNPKNPKEFFFRKGRAGTGREELTAKTLHVIAAEANPIYVRARTVAESGQGIPATGEG